MQIKDFSCPYCGYDLEEYLSQNDELEFDIQDEADDEMIRDFWSDHLDASDECRRKKQQESEEEE